MRLTVWPPFERDVLASEPRHGDSPTLQAAHRYAWPPPRYGTHSCNVTCICQLGSGMYKGRGHVSICWHVCCRLCAAMSVCVPMYVSLALLECVSALKVLCKRSTQSVGAAAVSCQPHLIRMLRCLETISRIFHR